jgi:hypothetical protein
MKMNFTYVFLTFILVFLIFISMSKSCVSFKPYSENDIFTKQYPFEPLTNLTAGQYSDTNVMSLSDKKSVNGITTPSKLAVKPDTESGFLGYSIYGSDNKKEVFSGTKGSTDCDTASSGLTNSMGGLCLSDTQKQLLQTRGGNATGGDFQIGN